MAGILAGTGRDFIHEESPYTKNVPVATKSCRDQAKAFCWYRLKWFEKNRWLPYSQTPQSQDCGQVQEKYCADESLFSETHQHTANSLIFTHLAIQIRIRSWYYLNEYNAFSSR